MSTEKLALVIDCAVPYPVTISEPLPGTIMARTYTVKNFLGMDGIEALKRANPYGEASGYVDNDLINVYEDKIEVLPLCGDFDRVEQIFVYLLAGYQSVGWQCLTQLDN